VVHRGFGVAALYEGSELAPGLLQHQRTRRAERPARLHRVGVVGGMEERMSMNA